MKVTSVEKPTDEELYYIELIMKSSKNDLDIYDRIFPSLLTVSGIFITANLLTGSIAGIITAIIGLFSFLFSFIGIIPYEKNINPYRPEEMKEYIIQRKKEKRSLLYLSIFLLFLSFGISIATLLTIITNQ
jgi:uncharacterized membrane protein